MENGFRNVSLVYGLNRYSYTRRHTLVPGSISAEWFLNSWSVAAGVLRHGLDVYTVTRFRANQIFESDGGGGRGYSSDGRPCVCVCRTNKGHVTTTTTIAVNNTWRRIASTGRAERVRAAFILLPLNSRELF